MRSSQARVGSPWPDPGPTYNNDFPWITGKWFYLCSIFEFIIGAWEIIILGSDVRSHSDQRLLFQTISRNLMMMSLSKSKYKLRFYGDFLLDGCLSLYLLAFSLSFSITRNRGHKFKILYFDHFIQGWDLTILSLKICVGANQNVVNTEHVYSF